MTDDGLASNPVRGRVQRVLGNLSGTGDCEGCLSGAGFDYLAGAEASGADPDAADAAVDHGTDPADVGPLNALGLDVGVAHVVAHHAFLPTDLALHRHGTTS